jgi:starch synthase
MKVLFASAECAPFFKTGGLGDVAGALPKELAQRGVELSVVLPFFTKMPIAFQEQCEEYCDFYVDVGWRHQYCGIKRLALKGVTYYFIDNQYYFDRDNLYGYEDDSERFAFFSLAIIEMLEKIDWLPDVIHVNDFHSAMVPFLLKEKYQQVNAYRSIKTILTIHNIEFQGAYDKNVLPDFFDIGLERFDDGSIRLGDSINYLKAGIVYADRVNTVSPTYAKEIQTPEFGFGLDEILRLEQEKLSGILNGIDVKLYDPQTDEQIPMNFSVHDLSGKAHDKQALQEKMNLPIRQDIPLIGVVSRLTVQKGFRLLLDELTNILENEVQIVLLGTGDPEIEESFRQFSNRYPNQFRANILFDVSLAQLIYAGADLFLMPSVAEPCGLSQIIAMRYGAVPIVHGVGGLKDTVLPFDPETKAGTGFVFTAFTSDALLSTISRAITMYQSERVIWTDVMNQGMTKDFSWEKSAKIYLELYKRALA